MGQEADEKWTAAVNLQPTLRKCDRLLAHDSGHTFTQTTPHLFGWLTFTNRLGEADNKTVVKQHVAMEQILAPHSERAYEMALHCRINPLSQPPVNPPSHDSKSDISEPALQPRALSCFDARHHGALGGVEQEV